MMLSMYRYDLPDWVKEHMMMQCEYCGSVICDNSDTGVTTSRWCPNPSCPGHMAHRVKALTEFFGISGVGPATALDYICMNKMTSHFDFMPIWFKDLRPEVHLYDIAVMACIEGYGKTQAEKELSGYGSFQEYFARTQFPNALLVARKDMLIDAQKYFTILQPLAFKKLFVMGTGSFHGFQNRSDFFNSVNAIFGQKVHVIETGKRKTGISFLIKEPDAVDHSKSQIARDYGIPIITPAELVNFLHECFPECEIPGKE